jgi:hypothetical protein
MRITWVTRVAGFGLVTAALFTPAMKAQTVIISNEHLVSTTLVVNETKSATSCKVIGCSAKPVLLFKPIHITCPRGVGKTCTLNITIDAKTDLSPDAKGLYEFSLDGVAPTPGPTDKHGFYLFSLYAPQSDYGADLPVRQSYPASIVGTVTNSRSRDHTIDVRVTCTDWLAQGSCEATTYRSTMRIDVFEP